MRLELLHAKALRKALIEAKWPEVKTERTIRRYIVGDTPWPPALKAEVERLLGASELAQGQTKEAAPVTGRLLAGAIAIERKLGITSEELAAAEAEANILLVRLLDTNGTPPPPAASGGAAVSGD